MGLFLKHKIFSDYLVTTVAKMILRCLFSILTIFPSYFAAAQSTNLNVKYTSNVPATSSVLASGKWYKIKIFRDGIYRLSYEDLIALGFSDPSAIRVFGNGGTMVPLMNAMPRYDDLIENTIYINKGSDGVFNKGDYILFYGRGPVTWKYNSSTGMFEHELHLYSNASYYFLTSDAGSGMKISAASPVTGTPTVSVTAFDDYIYHEENQYNLIKSGRQWFGERVSGGNYDTVFTFSNLVTTSQVKMKVNAANHSSGIRNFTITANGSTLGTIKIGSVDVSSSLSPYAIQSSGTYLFTSTGDNLHIVVSYNKSLSTDEGYLDYIILNARRQLTMTGNSMPFRDISVAGAGVVASFTVEGCTSSTEIWDVTDPFRIRRMPSVLSGTTLTFSDSTKTLKEYIAVNTDAAFPQPELKSNLGDIGTINNQNLHASASDQLLIVTHPSFINAADSIAKFHREKDNISVLVATTDQVYNEFSSGAPDVSAIRDFARLLFQKQPSGDHKLKYLLLLGDGSYNNISQASGNSNYILTYQSQNSLDPSSSYETDDFFGMLEDDEGGVGGMENYSLDIGIGRIPVSTEEEALAVYKKIRNYNTPENMTDWRNNILFAADDGNNNLHTNQANQLATYVDTSFPQFAIKRVFLDAFTQENSSNGARYPEAHDAICNNIEKGVLIFNYTGHSGETGLADERVFTSDDIEKLTNIDHLPLFVTASCEFSRFDDLSYTDGVLIPRISAGELSLLNPNGGSIALITTTRLAEAGANFNLNANVYQVIFKKDTYNDYYRLGEVMQMTKNLTGKTQNKLNFTLLGDPALRLNIPNYSVVTDSINGISVNEPTDTLKAFSVIRFSGHVEDENKSLMDGFNGTITPSVFDKMKSVTTLNNDHEPGDTVMKFNTQEDLLYKGNCTVTNGRFSFNFMVPKDITYSFGKGKLTYYAQNSAHEANGYFSNFIIGGSATVITGDHAGPEVSLYLNDRYFNNEGISNPNPVIYALITDESGINTVGNGIGHDITGVIDGDVTNPVIMNEYFETNLNDYTAGKLQYPMKDLSLGWHSLRVKVWDVFNNSSEKTIDFKVISPDEMVITKAYNYPNPARDHTFFVFEHNKPDEELDVSISIFDLSGRLITTINQEIVTAGFSSTPLEWNLRDQNGNLLKTGIYPYRIRIRNADGSYADDYQKIVVFRQ